MQKTKEDVKAVQARINSLTPEQQNIGLDDFEFLKILGEGASAAVVLARKKDTQKLFAVKIMNKEAIEEEGELKALMSEKRILQNDSPFLVHLHFSFQTETQVFLVMDFLGGGDLAFLLQREERFPEPKVQFLAAQLVLALEYLHSRGVLYRDLRPENILFDKDGNWKRKKKKEKEFFFI
jgi:serine/threonine protein kinase